MIYTHRFTVHAPLADVVTFHQRSDSMGAITPPPIGVQVHYAPPRLREGDQMDFTLWLGPIPLRWVARIEQTTPISFVDRQLRGPFDQWVHLHTFLPLDEQTTAVVDRVEAHLSQHWFWRLVGINMWLGLPILFAYRAWKTRQTLQSQPVFPLAL